MPETESGHDGELEDRPADGVPWSKFLAEATERFSAADANNTAGIEDPATEARRIIEVVAGYRGPDGTADRPFFQVLEDFATQRGVATFDRMVARRLTGEPLQYVLGSWAFRTLDLFIDQRVLIPRPETEHVVEHALAALDEVFRKRKSADNPPLVVDLGTGSGAIALSVATERPKSQVWATDVSDEALAVASANLAGAGRVGARVRLARGDWFGALPEELLDSVDLIVANPPYIGAGEELPPSVRDWEPGVALVGGDRGDEQLVKIMDQAPRWLTADGALVMEMASPQVSPIAGLAKSSGFDRVEVITDLAGLERGIVAFRGEPGVGNLP